MLCNKMRSFEKRCTTSNYWSSITNGYRYCSSQCSVQNKNEESKKSFEEIPGPKSLPLIGTLWQYLPFIGKYSFDRLHHGSEEKVKKFGPVYREEFFSGHKTIWILKPDDVRALFRDEGKLPMRESHSALAKFRLDRPEIYNNAGLLPTNGPEWQRIRTPIQKYLSRIPNLRRYLPGTNEILDEFCNYMTNLFDQKNSYPSCLQPYFSRLYLELICLVAFDHRLKCFSSSEMKPTSLSSLLIKSAFDTNNSIMETDNGPRLWRYFDTPLYKKLKNAQLYMESVAIKLVSQKNDKLKSTLSENPSLLEQLLTSSELDYKDIIGFACDMLLAGIDTTSFTTSFVFYNIAIHADVQEKMFKEISALLPESDTPVTSEILEQAKYTRAVLKESLRLHPIAIGIGRIVSNDSVFSNFHIPSGTIVISQNQTSSRMEEYFHNAKDFIPQRWIKSDPNYVPINPYTSLPFGHGPRSCIARRLAEQNIQLVLIKVIRNFEISWRGPPNLDCKSFLINKPDRDVALTFTPRKNL